MSQTHEENTAYVASRRHVRSPRDNRNIPREPGADDCPDGSRAGGGSLELCPTPPGYVPGRSWLARRAAARADVARSQGMGHGFCRQETNDRSK
jgi:hypothetical protein